jgi:hypothetical protein
MKTVLLFLLTWVSCTPLFAQQIDLPTYTMGVHSRDTLQTFYIHESMDFSMTGTLPAEFITGVSFKILIDSVQFPGSSNAGSSAIHKGDAFTLPVTVQVFNGVVIVHLIIDGTPQIGGESYLCDLSLFILTDVENGVLIGNNTNTTCTVNTIEGNDGALSHIQPQFYPNPFNTSTVLKVDELSTTECTLLLFNKQGTLLHSQPAAQGKVQLNKNDLQTGMYFYQLKNEQTILTTGKLLVE